jgi:hypothetical protein
LGKEKRGDVASPTETAPYMVDRACIVISWAVQLGTVRGFHSFNLAVQSGESLCCFLAATLWDREPNRCAHSGKHAAHLRLRLRRAIATRAHKATHAHVGALVPWVPASIPLRSEFVSGIYRIIILLLTLALISLHEPSIFAIHSANDFSSPFSFF